MPPPREYFPRDAESLHTSRGGGRGAIPKPSPVEGLTGVCEGQDQTLRTAKGTDPGVSDDIYIS